MWTKACICGKGPTEVQAPEVIYLALVLQCCSSLCKVVYPSVEQRWSMLLVWLGRLEGFTQHDQLVCSLCWRPDNSWSINELLSGLSVVYSFIRYHCRLCRFRAICCSTSSSSSEPRASSLSHLSMMINCLLFCKGDKQLITGSHACPHLIKAQSAIRSHAKPAPWCLLGQHVLRLPSTVLRIPHRKPSVLCWHACCLQDLTYWRLPAN